MEPRRRELREQLRLSVPLVLSQLAQHLMGLVDTALLGRYHETALAGAGIGNSLIFTVTVLGMGIVMGADTLIPQAIGAGEQSRARRLLWETLRLAALIALPLTVITAATPLILPVAGVEPAVAEVAATYVYWRLPALLPFLLFFALRAYLQALDLTRPIVIAMVLGNLVNLGVDLGLIFGVHQLGIPAMGAQGAAMATSAVSVVTMLILVVAVRQVKVTDAGDWRVREPATMVRIFRLGLPVGLQLVAEVGIFGLTSVLAGRLGATAAGAHQVALMLISFTFAVAIGIGAATSVRVGQAVGRADQAATRRAGIIGLLLGAGFMSFTALMFLLVPEQLARLFTNEPEVIATAVPLIWIGALFQLSDGAQAIGAGALRGAGDTRSPLWANLAGHYLIGAPVMLGLVFGAELGAQGLWWGLSAGLTATALALIARFLVVSRRVIPRA